MAVGVCDMRNGMAEKLAVAARELDNTRKKLKATEHDFNIQAEQIRDLQEQSNRLNWELTEKDALIAKSDNLSMLEEEQQDLRDLTAAHQIERAAAEERAEKAEAELAEAHGRIQGQARELESVRLVSCRVVSCYGRGGGWRGS